MAAQIRPTTRLLLAGDKLQLHCRFEDREAAKAVPGYRWNKNQKCWEYPLRAYQDVIAAFPLAQVSPAVRAAVGHVEAQEQSATEIKLAGWQNATPIEPMPLKTKPYQHQVAAYNFIIQLLGVSKG